MEKIIIILEIGGDNYYRVPPQFNIMKNNQILFFTILNPNTQYPYSYDRKSATSSSSMKLGISTIVGRHIVSSPSVS